MEEIDITSATPMLTLDSSGEPCDFQACGISPIKELPPSPSTGFNMKALTI